MFWYQDMMLPMPTIAVMLPKREKNAGLRAGIYIKHK
jgi:hypothetical protein